MLDQLVGDVEHGRVRNQQDPSGRRRAERNHHVNDEGPCLVTVPVDQLVSLLRRRMKEAQSPSRSFTSITVLHVDRAGNGCGGTGAPGGFRCRWCSRPSRTAYS